MSPGVSQLPTLVCWANPQHSASGSDVGLLDIRVSPAWIGETGMPLPLTTLIVAIATAAVVLGVLVQNRRTRRALA